MLIIMPYSHTGARTGGSNQISTWYTISLQALLTRFLYNDMGCYTVFKKKKVSDTIAAFLWLPLGGFCIEYISTDKPNYAFHFW